MSSSRVTYNSLGGGFDWDEADRLLRSVSYNHSARTQAGDESDGDWLGMGGGWGEGGHAATIDAIAGSRIKCIRLFVVGPCLCISASRRFLKKGVKQTQP